MKTDDKGREAYNLYQRQWRARNKERVKAINHRYWQKRALEMKEKKEREAESNGQREADTECL